MCISVRDLAQRGPDVPAAVGGIFPPLGPAGERHHQHCGDQEDLGDHRQEQRGSHPGHQAQEGVGEPHGGGQHAGPDGQGAGGRGGRGYIIKSITLLAGVWFVYVMYMCKCPSLKLHVYFIDMKVECKI